MTTAPRPRAAPSVPPRLLAAGVVLVALSAVLLLARPGHPLLWEDEAETAVIARNLLEQGVPSPAGRGHLVTQTGGADSRLLGGRLVWIWHPWLQHLLVAGSFALFGEGTAAARWPFLLVSAASLPLFFRWRLERAGPAAALAATAIYGLTPVFLLHGRQCRYYALLLLGGVLALSSYSRLARGRRRDAVVLGLSLALLVWANPLSGLAVAAGLTVHAAWRSLRRRRPGPLLRLAPPLALWAVLSVPWLAFALGQGLEPPDLGLAGRLRMASSLLWRAQHALLPLVLWPVLAWRLGGADTPRAEREEIALLGVLAAVSLPLIAAEAPMATARYLLPVWPLAAAVLGHLAAWLSVRWTAWAGAAFVLLVIGTNLFAALPAMPVAWTAGPVEPDPRLRTPIEKLAAAGRLQAPLALWLTELARPEPGPVEAVVELVRALPRPPRAVAAGYAWDSLHFYLGVPVAGAAGARVRRAAGLPAVDPATVDVVVPRRGWPGPEPPPGFPHEFVAVSLPVPDRPYENIPEVLDRYGVGPGLPPLTVYVRRSLWTVEPEP